MGKHHKWDDHHDHSHDCCNEPTFRVKAITRDQKIKELKDYHKALTLEIEWVNEKIKALEEAGR